MDGKKRNLRNPRGRTPRKSVCPIEQLEQVLIIGGPFAGSFATIMEAKPGAKRVRAFLKALGRLTDKPTQINVLDVQKVMAA